MATPRPVAQLVERAPDEREAAGSNPAGATNPRARYAWPCRYCGSTTTHTADRQAHAAADPRRRLRNWRLVCFLYFTPEPEAAAGALCCPECMKFLNSATGPRQKYFFTTIEPGSKERALDLAGQIESLEHRVTEQLRADGYSLAAYCEELHAGAGRVRPQSAATICEEIVKADLIPGFKERLQSAAGAYPTMIRATRGECPAPELPE